MRPAAAFLFLTLPVWCGETGNAPVTVLLDFDQPHSPVSVAAMQHEAQRLLSPAGLRVDVAVRDKAGAQGEFRDVLLFHMKGRCAMDPYPVLFDERGPLGMSYTSDGVVLPFGEIRCDRVRNALKRTATGDDYAHGDDALGRALGRVLAHEMYHMLAKAHDHGANGITQPRLSSTELRSGDAAVDDASLGRLRPVAAAPGH